MKTLWIVVFFICSSLALDTANVTVQFGELNAKEISRVELWGITSNCYKCLKLPLTKNVSYVSTNVIQIDTRYPFNFEWKIVTSSGQNVTHACSYHFDEDGEYQFLLNGNNKTDPFAAEWACQTVTQKNGINSNIPILIAFCVYAGLALLWIGITRFYRHYQDQKYATPSSDQTEDKPNILLQKQKQEEDREKAKNKNRIKSLDSFRGMCITIMIFVNYGGGGYYFFDHSTWNGLTVADLVFPWFIFIMGTAMALSFDALIKKKASRGFLLKKAIRRSIILFGLGLFMNDGFYLNAWRIPGVLQRFGVSYLAVTIILLYVPKFENNEGANKSLNHDDDPLLPSTDSKYRKISWFADITPYFLEWMVVALLLTTWFIITFTLHVPGCGAGYLGPGGLADDGLFKNCTGGAAGYIDKLVFGENHIYNTPTCQDTYLTGSYDPEGLLGYLTSISLCYMGVQMGRILLSWKSPVARMKRWLCWGLFWGTLGTILCFGQQNGGPVPINKNLWSASFIFVMAGSGNIVLAIYYFLVDVINVWNGAPFIYVGMNPILIFCGHEILQPYFPFSYNIVDPTHMTLMLSNLIGVSTWLLLAYYMYYHKFFINI